MSDVKVINNDGSYSKHVVAIIKGCGLHWGLSFNDLVDLHTKIGNKIEAIKKKHEKVRV
jgi:hypothetical protein